MHCLRHGRLHVATGTCVCQREKACVHLVLVRLLLRNYMWGCIESVCVSCPREQRRALH